MASEISQAEYEKQEDWLRRFASEQRDIQRLRRLIAEYPEEARTALAASEKGKGNA